MTLPKRSIGVSSWVNWVVITGCSVDPQVGKQALLLKAVLSTRAGLDAQVYT